MPKINAWLLGPLSNGNSLPPPPRSAPLTSSRYRCSEKDKGPGRYRPSPCLVGGASRDRTDDLYNAIVALSQLSYGPKPRNQILMAAGGIIRSPRLGNRCWLAVASALVVLDLDFDTVLVVLEVGIRQRVIGLGITEIFALRGLEFLLGGGGLGGGSQHGGSSGGRGGSRLAAAANLHEVFTIVLTPALRAF